MKKSFFSKISTKPNPAALKWAGTEWSLLANILLWFLWLCRVFSVLQYIKYLYRTTMLWAQKIQKKREANEKIPFIGRCYFHFVKLIVKKGTTDEKAFRPNVPPIICELYFVFWCGLMICGHLLHWEHLVFRIAIIYYLFEAIVWVLYYTVFRRFYEENYSIYHELEYLTELLLVVPTQALGFATLYNQSFRQILAGLMGVGGDTAPFPVKILGALFAAIVISMIISAFPAEMVKKYTKQPKTMIIGNGDVVKNRLLNALNKEGCTQVQIFDLAESKRRDGNIRYYKQEEDIIREVSGSADPQSVIWIATPSTNHICYLQKLIETKIALIVLEKPITCKEEELPIIQALVKDESKRKKIFFLSYYILEKALPLKYLHDLNPAYLPFLDIADKPALHNWRLRMGPLASARVEIHEGPEERSWTMDRGNHGQYLETFLHNVLIASMFCGQPQTWTDVKCEHTCHEKNSTIIMTAKSGNANIYLSQIKSDRNEPKHRLARFEFAHGWVEADINLRTVKLYFYDVASATHICVSDQYSEKYQVMVKMVEDVYNDKYTCAGVDGLKDQIEVIQWLINISNEKQKKDTPEATE